jgi:hypothetical protein
MEATRGRAHLAPTGEWLVATVFLLATIGVSALILQELRTPALPAMPAEVESAEVPASIPPQAVSVSSLLLMNGTVLHVGDTEAQIASELQAAALEGSAEDRGSIGRRVTRAYQFQGTRFLLVFEPFERQGELRIAGIYIR